MATQQTVEKQGAEGKEKYIEVTVLFHTHTIKVKVKKGATKKEIWEAIKKKVAEEGIEIGDVSRYTITIRGVLVVINEAAGTIEEVDEDTGVKTKEVQDEKVYEDITVALTENVVGGDKISPDKIKDPYLVKE